MAYLGESIGKLGFGLMRLPQKDGVIDGDVDVESGFLRRHGEACVRSDDLTDDFAQATYLQGGDVYVLEKDQMPGDTGVAALYRY